MWVMLLQTDLLLPCRRRHRAAVSSGRSCSAGHARGVLSAEGSLSCRLFGERDLEWVLISALFTICAERVGVHCRILKYILVGMSSV